MLKKVRFKNYKSFTQETIISLEKTKLEILDDVNTNNNVLKGCAFFGSNASGKTNALNSISILLDMLLINGRVNIESQITVFNSDKTAYFEYTFDVDENEIVYYFEVDRNGCIVKEYLKLNGEQCFDRINNSAKSNITENMVYGPNDIDEHTLFVRNIYFNTKFKSVPVLAKWFEILAKSIAINLASSNKPNMLAFQNSIQEIVLPEYLEAYGDIEINHFLKEFNFPYKIKYIKAENPQDKLMNFGERLLFIRDGMTDIPFYMESYGNNILLNMMPAILTAAKNNSILIIDEFSSGLHNKLEELIVKFFYNNTKTGQLFFVSHSTNLLKTSLLRPDQIYSVDFNEKGSYIKKFSDEHPRESQNLEKMYLAGIFGGIPLYDKSTL